MNTQGHIVTTIPEFKKAHNCHIFNLVIRPSDFFHRGSVCHGTTKIKRENIRGNKNFENDMSENNYEVEKVRRKNSLVWNQEDSDSIHIYSNYNDTNQYLSTDSTSTGSIHDSDNRIIEEILLSPVNCGTYISSVTRFTNIFVW